METPLLSRVRMTLQHAKRGCVSLGFVSPGLIPVQGLVSRSLCPRGVVRCAASTSLSDPKHPRSVIHSVTSEKSVASPHVLYVVSTPIGNYGDITHRAASILSSVDIIAAEDTRRTGLLLKHVFGDEPRTSSLVSCHAHNWRARAPMLVDRLQSGASVAVVSDAGTPTVSDPGSELVRAAVDAGLRVVPVPGACAALAALVCATLPSGVEFAVLGFLPRKGKDRREALEKCSGKYADTAVVLYEAPHRVRATLSDLAETEALEYRDGGGKRSVCIGRELTKTFEEFLRFESIADACNHYCGGTSDDNSSSDDSYEGPEPRGEFTIVIGPRDENEEAAGGESVAHQGTCNAATLISELVAADIPVSAIAKAVSAASKMSKKSVYSYAQELKTQRESSSK